MLCENWLGRKLAGNQLCLDAWSKKSAAKHSATYSRGKYGKYPLYISTLEMRSLWMEIKCIRSASRLLDIDCVNKRGLDLSKEVLWVSVGQRAAVLQAVKVGGQKKILPISPARAIRVRTKAIGRIFFYLQLWQPIDLLPFDLQRPTVPL